MEEQENHHPSEFNSYYLDKALDVSLFELSKKRKLQDEQLVLPISKHKCWDHRIIFRPISEDNQEADDLIVRIIQENVEREVAEDGSDPESGKDSNSFVGDSDSIMSVQGEPKSEMEVSKQWPCIEPSSSSLNVCTAIEGTGEGQPALAAEEHYPYYHCNELHQNLGEPLIEIESNPNYMCSEHSIEGIEQYTDKDIEDLLYSNGGRKNKFILSSGRWSVDQDAQPSSRKPTIDQEFEQYFSTLML